MVAAVVAVVLMSCALGLLDSGSAGDSASSKLLPAATRATPTAPDTTTASSTVATTTTPAPPSTVGLPATAPTTSVRTPPTVAARRPAAALRRAQPGAGAATPLRSPAAPHVMIVMMENKNFSEVIGQTDQPYTNSLASAYGLATDSYAFGHGSLPNYLEIVSGSSQGVTDDNPPSAHSFPGTPTLADQLAQAGVTAKAYAENLPSDPTNDAGEYAVRHFPWEYFPGTRIPVADASSLLPDLNAAGAPDFVWYTPNLIDDEHDGTPQQGDAFLSSFIPQVQSTAWYRAGGRIIIEWDESDTDNTALNGGSGGGRVPTIVVSEALRAHPQQDPAPVSTAGILHSIEKAFGLGYLADAGAAANGNIDTLLAGS